MIKSSHTAINKNYKKKLINKTKNNASDMILKVSKNFIVDSEAI